MKILIGILLLLIGIVVPPVTTFYLHLTDLPFVFMFSLLWGAVFGVAAMLVWL
jgi:hypothetical protein